MRRKLLASANLLAIPFMLLGTHVYADEFSAKLVGFEEVPAIFSQGKGTLDLDLNRNARTLAYKLTFSGLSAPVTQSHIHFGKRHVAGGISVFFCGSLTNPGPVGTPMCPAGGGTVTGTITGVNVIGPVPQGIPVGDFDAVVALLDTDTAYANVHTVNFPAGEIRGQIRDRDREDEGR
jgi:hypothetical protein